MTEWKLALPDQVVVTGTSSGLGLAMARLLTSTGVRVYGVDTADPPPDLANLETFRAVRGSVTDAGTWRRAIAALTADAPDGVVSLGYVGAAAVLDVGVLAHEDMAVWQRTWEVNVLGNVLALRELLPLLTSAEYAAVVAVSSINAAVRRATAGRLLILEGRADQRRAHDRTRLRPSWGEGQHPGPRGHAGGPLRAPPGLRHRPGPVPGYARGSPTHRPAPRGGRGGAGGRLPALVGGLGPIRQHIDRRRRVDS